jgi:hypothetical protein
MNAQPASQAFEAETAATAAVDDRIYADIHDVADNVRSLAVSLREAAWRRDAITLRIHRAEFRQQATLLLGLIRDIAPLEGEVTASKRKGAVQ